MSDRVNSLLIVLTFGGMVGLYVLLYLAYQKYQEQTAKGTLLGFASSLIGGP